MAKYVITVEETLRHVVEIEADTESEACECAIASVVEDCDRYFMNVEDRCVVFVLKK